MTAYDALQWTIVLGGVLLSGLYTLGRAAPQWRAQLALNLQRPRYASWLNRVGRYLGAGAGCGACDSCGSCAPSKSAKK